MYNIYTAAAHIIIHHSRSVISYYAVAATYNNIPSRHSAYLTRNRALYIKTYTNNI